MDDSITPLIVHPATAIFGDTEGAVYPGYGHAPLATGVRAHDWSPDGKRLFYVVLDAAPQATGVRHGADVVIERARRRAPGTAGKSVGWEKSVPVRVELGGRRIIKKKN